MSQLELHSSTFLYNAGIVGMIKLLRTIGGRSGRDFFYDQMSLKINLDFLKEKDLAKAFMDTYVEEFYEISAYAKIMKKGQDLESITKNGTDITLEKEIVDATKEMQDEVLKASYKSGLESLERKDIIEIAEEMKKSKDVSIKQACALKLYKYLQDEDVKDTLVMKSVIYNIINMIWDGKCFLNRTNAKKKILPLIESDFIGPFVRYLAIDNSKKSTKECIECGHSIYKESHSLSFLVDSVDDTSRKKSWFWNLKTDADVCPICGMIYGLSPLGFISLGRDLAFINSNDNVEQMFKINQSISFENENEVKGIGNQKFNKMINRIIESEADIASLKVDNLQIIIRSKEENHYLFNIIDRQIAWVLKYQGSNISKLSKIFVKVNEGYINVYESCINNILNHRNQYSLINQLIIIGVSDDNRIGYIWNILQVQITQKGGQMVENLNKKAYVLASKGLELRTKISKDPNEVNNKLRGLIYKLLNSLQVNDRELFMDTVIRLYSGIGDTIPNLFLQMFESEDDFKTLGYAFILGLKGEKRTEIEEEKKHE